MKKKLQNLLEELNHGLIERQEAVKLSLLAALASEHMLLVGPPGTGKSMIARRISECFNGSGAGTENDYFEYLLTKFSTPEEIFGPLSISELKADRFKRNTAGYLPTVKVAFLDEIFKASSSILNALLTILNERIYHNGTDRQKVPLQSLIAASNELPVGQDELNALYDRFLVRCFVDYVSTDSLPRFFETDTSESSSTYLGEADLKSIQDAASAVILPALVQEVIQEIWIRHKEVFKEDRREQLSDRRLKKIIHLLRVAAATNDRSEVDLSDVLLLKNCLWNHSGNTSKVHDLVLDALRQQAHRIPNKICRKQGYGVAHAALTPTVPKTRFDVVKGYFGSGTKSDPLLIGNVDELLGLRQPEVGLHGYHFRQIADIDCSGLSSWHPIEFRGCFDGCGFVLRGDGCNAERWHGDKWVLFESVGGASKIHGLNLVGFCFAKIAQGSHISRCKGDEGFITKRASDCTIEGCVISQYLIRGEAGSCSISRCLVGSFLIEKGDDSPGVARKCNISDCMVVLDYDDGGGDERGGVVNYLMEGSVVSRCLVTGQLTYTGSRTFDFSGIALKCSNSEINSCAVGPLQYSSSDVCVRPRICGVDSKCELKNNAAIDTIRVSGYGSDPTSPDGLSVPSSGFNHYFFRNSLSWDFEKFGIGISRPVCPLLKI